MRTSVLISLAISLIQVDTFRLEPRETDKNDYDTGILPQLVHKKAEFILHEMSNALSAHSALSTWTAIDRRLFVAASEKLRAQMADGMEPGYPEWTHGIITRVKIDKSSEMDTLSQAVYLMVVGDLLLNFSKNLSKAAKAYKDALETLKDVTGDEEEEAKRYETMIRKKSADLNDLSIVLENPFLDQLNVHLKNGDHKPILRKISEEISHKNTILTWKLREIYIETSIKLRIAIGEGKEQVPKSWQDILPNMELNMNAHDSKLVDQAVYLILVGDFVTIAVERGDPVIFYTEALKMLQLVRDAAERPYVERYRNMIQSRIQTATRNKDIHVR